MASSAKIGAAYVGLVLVLAYVPTPAQVAACAPDVMRLCAAEIPNVKRIIACMTAKQGQISAACRATLRGGKM